MAERVKIQSSKVKFGQHFMRSFLARPFDDGDRIYTDPDARGLMLKVAADRASWIVRYKKTNTTIGYAALKDLKQARSEPRMLTSVALATSLSGVVRSLIDKDPALIKPFLGSYYGTPQPEKRDALAAVAAAEAHLAREKSEGVHDNAWTLQQALDNFIQQRTRPGQRKPIKDTYADELRSTVARKEFQEVIGKPVTRLTSKMAEDIRDAIERNSGISPAKKAVTAIRTVLSYTHQSHRGQSGLEGAAPWWLMLTSDTVIKARVRKPSIDGVGITLTLAEYFLDHKLPGRVGVQHGLRDNVFAGFVWIVLSGQRQGSGLSLRATGLVPYPGKEDWYMAIWEDGEMKNSRRFALPIPPRMMSVLKLAVDRSKIKESVWAFPSEDGPDKHVGRSATLGVVKRLAARDDLAKKLSDDDRTDLFALNGVDYWSPHDLRRTLTEIMDLAGMPGGASAVLAHTLDAGSERSMTDAQFADWLKNRIAGITRDSYGDIQHLNLKCDAMLVWTNAVLDAWEAARSRRLIINKTGDRAATLTESSVLQPVQVDP